MHHVEGAQCGLPLISHADGGGIVEAAEKYGVLFEDNLKETLLSVRKKYPFLREKIFQNMPNGDRMAGDYIRAVHRVLSLDPTCTRQIY